MAVNNRIISPFKRWCNEIAGIQLTDSLENKGLSLSECLGISSKKTNVIIYKSNASTTPSRLVLGGLLIFNVY